MTAVEIFAVLFFGVAGYMVVNHFMRPGERREPTEEGPATGAEQTFFPKWCEVLGVDPAASVEDIRRAYQLQVSRYHPDKVAHLADEFKAMAEWRAKEINAAYAEALRGHGVAP